MTARYLRRKAIVIQNMTVVSCLALGDADRPRPIFYHFFNANLRTIVLWVFQGEWFLRPRLLDTRPLAHFSTGIQIQIRVLLDALVHRREHESARALHLSICHIIVI